MKQQNCGVLPFLGKSSRHNFVIVQSRNNWRLLLRMLRHKDFPEGAEVVTQELSAIPYVSEKLSPQKQRECFIALAGQGAVPVFRAAAKKKNLRLWIGAPYYDSDEDKLYNSYGLFDKQGELLHLHSKRYLWKTERALIPGTERAVFDKPDKFDGDFERRKILICHEAFGFWDPIWHKCRFHEARKRAPKIIILPAHWEGNPLATLRKVCLSVVRRARTALDAKMAANPEGCVLLLANYNRAAVFGPAEAHGRIKGKCYVELTRPGWIHVRGNTFSAHPFKA